MPKRGGSAKRAPRPENDTTVPAPIRTAICELLGVDEPEVRRDRRLVEELGADSLDLVELAMGLEETYGRPIGDEVIDTWGVGTVGTVIETLEAAGAKL